MGLNKDFGYVPLGQHVVKQKLLESWRESSCSPESLTNLKLCPLKWFLDPLLYLLIFVVRIHFPNTEISENLCDIQSCFPVYFFPACCSTSLHKLCLDWVLFWQPDPPNHQLLFPNVSLHGHWGNAASLSFSCSILVPCPSGFPSVFLRLPELHFSKQIYNMFYLHIHSINFYHKHCRKERPKQIHVPWIQSWQVVAQGVGNIMRKWHKGIMHCLLLG